MATIIWCDKIKHVVKESRTEVADLVAKAQTGLHYDATGEQYGEQLDGPWGFVYLTPQPGPRNHQRAFRVALISTFEAVPGQPI